MKRSKLSGAQYKKSKRQREQAAEKDAASMSSWLSQTSHSSGIDVAMAGMAVRAVEAPESSDEAESASSEGEGEHSTNEPDTVAAITVSEEVHSEVGSAISMARDITDSRIFSDIGYLKYPVADELRLELVKRCAEPLQQTDGPFEVVNGRSLTSSWFTCILQNQKTVPRTWLLCSPSKGCAFCFCCLLKKQTDRNTARLVALTDFALGRNSIRVCMSMNAAVDTEQPSSSGRNWNNIYVRIPLLMLACKHK